MSDFLKQLEAESDKRDNSAQLFQEAEAFGEKYLNKIAETLLKSIKNSILDFAKKGEFSCENGKRVISGEYKFSLSSIPDYCGLEIKNEKKDWAGKFYSMNLKLPETISFDTRPIFHELGMVTRSEKKKILWFEKTVQEKKKQVSFTLSKGLQTIMRGLKEQAQSEGITLSDLTFGYMFNTINKETGKTNGLWVTNSVTFGDLVSPVLMEWTWFSEKCVVDFGGVNASATIKFSVEY